FLFAIGLAQFLLGRVVNRQVDGETRTLDPAIRPVGVVGEDEPARLLDDAVNRGQAEAGALPLFLGGEERFEDLRQVFQRNAAAGVLGNEHRVIARRDDLAARAAHVAGRDAAGRERQR